METIRKEKQCKQLVNALPTALTAEGHHHRCLQNTPETMTMLITSQSRNNSPRFTNMKTHLVVGATFAKLTTMEEHCGPGEEEKKNNNKAFFADLLRFTAYPRLSLASAARSAVFLVNSHRIPRGFQALPEFHHSY